MTNNFESKYFSGYFSLIQPYYYKPIDEPTNHYYNFCLYPDDYQPSGMINSKLQYSVNRIKNWYRQRKNIQKIHRRLFLLNYFIPKTFLCEDIGHIVLKYV
jgi:hypothetical protein